MPVGVVQIDDGYEAAPGDWLVPADRFGDLPGLVGRIRDSGRRAGIWIAPMLVGQASALYADHPDWVVRDECAGQPGRRADAAVNALRPSLSPGGFSAASSARSWVASGAPICS
jgi:alpha-galactosidase